MEDNNNYEIKHRQKLCSNKITQKSNFKLFFSLVEHKQETRYDLITKTVVIVRSFTLFPISDLLN